MAVGVEVREEGKIGKTRTVRVKKMVVVSACAFGTPLLLERPGVGDPAVLQKTGEGCGNFVGYVYRINLTPNETLNGIAHNQRGRDVRRHDPQQ